MFKSIAEKITWPAWATATSRYRRLDLRDRLLDGTFYDHLVYSFYEEADHAGQYVEIKNRRPSTRFNLPRMVARTTARKIFAGRHRPRIVHDDADFRTKVVQVVQSCKFFKHMLKAAVYGSVGAVAVSFSIRQERENDAKARVIIKMWRAKHCQPVFDEEGDLKSLLIAYLVPGVSMAAHGFVVDKNVNYWYVRQITREEEIVFVPPRQNDWNPNKPLSDLMPDVDRTIRHDLKFVPAVWIVNLPGDEFPEGDCTWAAAIDDAIDLDYTMSQIGRGVRYNAGPQLMIKGEMEAGPDGDRRESRAPSVVIHLKADYKEADGITMTGGDARLLEMTGQGIKAGLEYVAAKRKLALEQIAADRKDPEEMKGPMSGRAMEQIDQEFHDLIQELREQYGEDGAMELLHNILRALRLNGNRAEFTDDKIAGVRLHWPNLFQPTPSDLGQMATWFQVMLTGGVKDGSGTKILTPDELRTFMLTQLDIPEVRDDDMAKLDNDDDEDDDNSGEPRPGTEDELAGGTNQPGPGRPLRRIVIDA